MINDLQGYYDRLCKTDWAYQMSDDPQAYRRGAAAVRARADESKQTEAHMKLYTQFHDFVQGRADKPERPA